ncbi:MAG: NAD(P)-dependent oxidoreductase [Desulfobulbaceae bacterium]|nr:NAD(P)-dependent oxidoreductase [Desulfobulbaceae bacterium]
MGKHILEEAGRCLQCKKPLCSKGCPVGTPVNTAIRLLLANKIQDAGALLFENNPLSVVCSLICPHEKFCEGHCIMGKKSTPVQWSDIEHYISSYFLDRLQADTFKTAEQKERIAIVGSGPAGLTVAFILAIHGYRITIFESKDQIGGVLQYGIPDFRLPKTILDKLYKALLRLNVKVRPNMLIGPVVSLEDLLANEYKAVFVGTGVWNPRPLRLPGETLGHVHYAISYLKNPDVCSLGYRVAVIGSGNVAMDVARTALRKGSEVTILYHRGEADMSATRYEYDYARMDGVDFEFFVSPVAISDEGVHCRTTRKVVDGEGKVRLEQIAGTERCFPADSVIIATGQAPRGTLKGLEIGKTGLVITDEVGRTTHKAVFASGDVVTGARTVVEAVERSKHSAQAIMDYVESLPKAD